MSAITPESIAAAVGKIVDDEMDPEIPFELYRDGGDGCAVGITAHNDDELRTFTLLVLPGKGSPLAEVVAERARQDAQWGQQDWPDGTGLPGDAWGADTARKICRKAADLGAQKWRHILREVVNDVFAEGDSAVLRAKLLEVSAVAVAWVEAIDRRTAAAQGGAADA